MSAHPKIQKMCEEESDDHEAVAKLLEINDSIHRTSERYKLIKQGNIEGAAKIPRGTLGTSGAGVSKGPNNELSLIDFGGPEDEPSSQPSSQPSGAATQPSGNALEDDLLGLSMDSSMSGGGAISLGPSTGFGKYIGCPMSCSIYLTGSGASSQAGSHLSNTQITDLFSQPAPPMAATSISPPPQYLFSPSPAQPLAQPEPKPDPFAVLAAASNNSRQASPFQFQQSTKPPSGALSPKPAQPHPASSSKPAPAADDEWEFASALPPQSGPTTITLHSSTITIVWELSRVATQPAVIEIKSKVSNNLPVPVTELTFKVAVTKVSHKHLAFRRLDDIR
jgi:ADP-ribosylation factor-binding protein GGA